MPSRVAGPWLLVTTATRYDTEGVATQCSVATGLAPVKRNGPKSACVHFVWRLAPRPVAFDGRKVHRDASEAAARDQPPVTAARLLNAWVARASE